MTCAAISQGQSQWPVSQEVNSAATDSLNMQSAFKKINNSRRSGYGGGGGDRSMIVANLLNVKNSSCSRVPDSD